MEQDIVRRRDPDVADGSKAEPPPVGDDDKRDARLTRRVHVVLGLVIAALGAWLLYKSRTELEFRGANNEPGSGLPSRPADHLPDRPRPGADGGVAVRPQGAPR